MRPTVAPPRPARADAVRVTDLFCLYTVPGGATVAALRGMSLHVAPGERLVVHGPNGSGKTTLLRVLTGEVAPSAGSVTVDGVELAGASASRIAGLRRTVLGLVDQQSGRMLRAELRVGDNVALQLRLAGHSRAEADARAGKLLGELGLATLADRRPATLSAGEAQRVAVCAAVAHNPTVLLADEPTGELDIDAADAVYDLLASAADRVGATLLLVTHDPRAARIGDRVVRIRDGRLSEQWHPDRPHDESLVVDSRGWVRLPEPLRQRAGILGDVSVDEEPGRIVLGGHSSTRDRSGWDADPDLVGPVPAPLPSPAADGKPLARLRHVHVAYGERTLFAGIDLVVQPAALTVVRGRSGAGKSTLLRLLLGLADPDSGFVSLAGCPLDGLDRAARADLRRSCVGVATQSGALAEPLDARENLTLARAARDLPPDDAVVSATIEALGLEPVARRPVRLLSGGERQRVAIARSLVVQRPLVVLDEPTSRQDEAHAELLSAALVAVSCAGAAVLCATHDPVLAAAADYVIDLR